MPSSGTSRADQSSYIADTWCRAPVIQTLLLIRQRAVCVFSTVDKTQFPGVPVQQSSVQSHLAFCVWCALSLRLFNHFILFWCSACEVGFITEILNTFYTALRKSGLEPFHFDSEPSHTFNRLKCLPDSKQNAKVPQQSAEYQRREAAIISVTPCRTAHLKCLMYTEAIEENRNRRTQAGKIRVKLEGVDSAFLY